MKYLTDSAVICTWSRLWLQAICLGVGPVRLRLSLYFFQAWQEDVWANNRAGETLFTHRYTFSISIYAHLSVSPAVGLHALHSFVCICRPPVVSIPLFLSVSLCEYSLCRLLKGDSLFSTLSRPTWKWPARFKRRLNKFSVVCWHFKYQASAEPSLPCPSGGISDVGVSLLMHDAWRPTYSLLCYLWCLIYHCHMTWVFRRSCLLSGTRLDSFSGRITSSSVNISLSKLYLFPMHSPVHLLFLLNVRWRQDPVHCWPTQYRDFSLEPYRREKTFWFVSAERTNTSLFLLCYWINPQRQFLFLFLSAFCHQESITRLQN